MKKTNAQKQRDYRERKKLALDLYWDLLYEEQKNYDKQVARKATVKRRK